jgi:hypothetical protein
MYCHPTLIIRYASRVLTAIITAYRPGSLNTPKKVSGQQLIVLPFWQKYIWLTDRISREIRPARLNVAGLLDEKAGKNAKDKQGGCQPPCQLFDEIY